jgi:hypothetical protein
VGEALFFTFALGLLCRFIFGTDKSWVMNRMALARGGAVYQAPAR